MTVKHKKCKTQFGFIILRKMFLTFFLSSLALKKDPQSGKQPIFTILEVISKKQKTKTRLRAGNSLSSVGFEVGPITSQIVGRQMLRFGKRYKAFLLVF